MSLRGPVAAILAAIMLGWPTLAAAEQLVVAEARGIALKPGATLDSAKPLSLKEGQHVTLISASGVTLQLDGPFDRPPGTAVSKGAGLGQKLAALGAGGQRFGEVGTTRGTRLSDLPSPWLLDVSRSGAVCLRDGDATPVLWRPAQSQPADITLMPDDRSWRATLRWPGGSDRLAVVPQVPLHENATYYVTIAGDRRAIAIHDVPASLTSPRMRAAWMVQQGCEAQAAALLKTAQ